MDRDSLGNFWSDLGLKTAAVAKKFPEGIVLRIIIDGERRNMKLDENGRCCGRKPLIYKRDNHYFCPRCDRAYDLNSKEHVENFFWRKQEDGSFLKRPTIGN